MFLAGWQPYQIPLGGSNRVGALGYAACAFELLQQSYELGVDLNWVVHASSSGGTQTGLVSGFAGANAAVEVLGVAVSGGEAENLAMLGELAEATADFLGIPPAAVKSRLQIDNRHVGPGYGQLTPETVEAIEIAARTEGLVLDPVYSGKAMAGLIANIRAGRFDAEHNVVFLHTGGAPGLFAYREAFSAPAV
jgi:L-cysteate sulfo-lyase